MIAALESVGFADLYLLFGLGFLGSVHCAQMCGPIVIAYSLPMQAPDVAARLRRKLLPAHLAYNAGRILTYTLIGAIAGLLGGSIALIPHLRGIANILMVAAGTIMLFAGLAMLDIIPGASILSGKPLSMVGRIFRPATRLFSSTSVASKFLLGLILGFLPCGLVYAALLKAVTTAAPLAGALSMTAFGLGTMSALLAVGLLSSAFSLQLGKWSQKLAGVSVILLGALLIWRGTMMVHMMTQGHMHEHH